MGLTLEERGAYTTLLDLMYDTDGDAGIPDRERWIAGHLNVSVRLWNKLRQSLIDAGKIDIIDGLISNPRYRIEREKSAETSRKRAENGSTGGYKSGEKRKKLNDINASDEANASPLPLYAGATDTEAESDIDDEERVSVPKQVSDPFGQIGELTARLARAAGVAVMPNTTRFPDQLDAVREWITMGLDPDTEIIPALEADAASRRKPRHSLKYYTPTMAGILARREAKSNGQPDRQDRSTTVDAASDFLSQRRALRPSPGA
jgi:uncharacterized protein YdaU (DUF1376 family)